MPASNIEITVDTEELNSKLSKSLKELGAFYDEYGRLCNRNEQFIAGLNMTQVRMGYWVDSMGRVRNATGELVEGLTSVQQKLGMFIDAQGNIRDAEGTFVAYSKEKLATLDAETKAEIEQVKKDTEAKERLKENDASWTKFCREESKQRMDAILEESEVRQNQSKLDQEKERLAKQQQENLEKENQRVEQIHASYQSILGTAASMSGQFATVSALLGQTNGELSALGEGFAVLGQSANVFFSTTSLISTVIDNYKELKTALNGATVAQSLLNLVSGNWITLAVAGGAAAVTGFSLYSVNANKAKDKTEELNQSTQKVKGSVDALAEAWKKVNKQWANGQQYFARSADTAMARVFNASAAAQEFSKAEDVTALYQKLQETSAKIQEIRDKTIAERGKNTTENQALKEAYQKTKDLQDQRAETEQKLAKIAFDFINKYKDQASESVKIGKDIENLNHLILLAKNSEAKTDEAIQAKSEQIAALESARVTAEQKLADLQKKEAEQEQERIVKKAKEEAEGKGWGKWLQEPDKNLDLKLESKQDLDDALKKAAEDLGEGTELYLAAAHNLTKAFEEKQKDFMSKSGLEALLKPKEDASSKREKLLQDIALAKANGNINDEEEARLKNEAEAQFKKDRLEELGLSSDLNAANQKTPEEIVQEKLNSIQSGFNEGLYSDSEAAKMVENAGKMFLNDSEEKEQTPMSRKAFNSESLESGSSELYKMMVSYSNPNEDKIKKATEKISEHTEETTKAISELNDKFSDFFKQIGLV